MNRDDYPQRRLQRQRWLKRPSVFIAATLVIWTGAAPSLLNFFDDLNVLLRILFIILRNLVIKIGAKLPWLPLILLWVFIIIRFQKAIDTVASCRASGFVKIHPFSAGREILFVVWIVPNNTTIFLQELRFVNWVERRNYVFLPVLSKLPQTQNFWVEAKGADSALLRSCCMIRRCWYWTSRLALAYGLKWWNRTVIMVSHDTNLVRRVGGDCFALMEDGGKLQRTTNGIDSYLKAFTL